MAINLNSTLNEVRARFGLIIPSSNRMAEPHAWRYTPPNVLPHIARLRMTGPYFMDLKDLLPKVEMAAATLADAKCDPIVFHCTANSMADGLAGEKQISSAIKNATGSTAITTASATLDAFKVLNVSRIVLVSPYTRSSHQHELDFLNEAGFDIVGERNLSLSGSDAYCTFPVKDWISEVTKMKKDTADAYFISCANICAIEGIEELEAILERPVVTSNQLVIWKALRIAGIKDTLPGLGKLLTLNLSD